MRISSIRRYYLASTIGLWLTGFVLVTAATTVSAVADIGASEDQTKARTPIHAAKHRGRYPQDKINERGIVVWECWEAPTGGWTKPQAMSLVRDLIPKALKKQIPRRTESKRGGEMLVYQDGTTVWLEYNSVNASYKLVAVWAPEYQGPEC